MLDQTISISNYFSNTTLSEWEEETRKNLKTSNLEDKLLFKSIEGFDIFPLHTTLDWTCSLSTFPSRSLPIDIKILESDLDITKIHNAGGSIIQELTYALFLFNQAVENKQENINIHIALDSLYFSNIAKLRAVRFMFERLIEESNSNTKFTITAHNSLREQTLFDPWTNMLRSTASSMAAILGGANLITSYSYDHLYTLFTGDKSSNLGIRNAQNELKILLEESHLDRVNDPGKGSFSIEKMTYDIIKFSWVKFLDTNDSMKLNLELFSKEVKETSIKRYELAQKRKITITGINNFANPVETLQSIYPNKIDFSKIKQDKLFPLRIVSSEFEILRANFNAKENKIGILLFEEEAKLSARVNFCKNYFEVIGADIKEYHLEDDLSEVKHIIICSTDEDYSNRLNIMISTAKKNNIKGLYIAGKIDISKYPEIVDALYMGQNIYKVLEHFSSEVC